MVTYGYYPGCSLHSTASEYDISFKLVCQHLGIELAEVPDWICCGTSPAHSSSHLLSVALPAKNLQLAEQSGQNEVVIPCASCFSRFKFAQYEITYQPDLREKINEIIAEVPPDGGKADFQNTVKVSHPLEIFNQLDRAALKKRVIKDLSYLRTVCYYGCLLTRPPKVVSQQPFGHYEYPMIMDRILEKVGVTILDWSAKTDCCGAAFALSETDAVLKLTNEILANARAVGANAIAVACPLCQANLDTRQAEIEQKYQVSYGIPILYFTQLMGLSFGFKPAELGLFKHLVSPKPLLV
ncbi:MAG: CoB--CoM heterodisulfide reductase iron-sulfur subunit B family protein [Planctomycetota bacterium]